MNGDETFDDVRRALAALPAVEPRAGAMERITRAVAAAADEAVVVDLRRRRVPRVAAVAAALVIIASVVGGLGGETTLPAVGDLIASHEAAASETVPAGASAMPMESAAGMGLTMPESMTMTHAYHQGEVTHLVYRDGHGEAVSVFRQDGSVDLDRLGAGEKAMMGDTPMWSTDVADRHVTVLDGDGYVWTVVGDHHDDEMMAMMVDDMPTRSPSVLDRLRGAVDVLVSPWRLGR